MESPPPRTHADPAAPRTGAARAPVRVAGHFGEFLQGRLGPGGPLALVTLPCPALAVSADVAPGAFALAADPALLPPERARGLLDALGLPVSGRFRLTAAMPPGGGAGASTAALVALARAAARLAGRPAPGPSALARACHAVEGAVDPVMHAAPAGRLWASREARMIGRLDAPPAFEVVGGFLGPGLTTDPADTDFPDIADLIVGWRRAVAQGDRAAVARHASLSAARTTARRGPAQDPTAGLARDLGALGHVRAHTGSARGLLFAPGAVPDRAGAILAAAGFGAVLRFATP